MQLLIWHRNVDSCLREAYRFQKSTLGPNHISVLSTLDAIADLMAWNNETESALEYYKTVLRQIRDNLITPLATRLNSLVLYKMHRIYFDQGDIDTAWNCLSEARLLLKQCSEFDQSYELKKIVQGDMDKMMKIRTLNGNESSKIKINLDKGATLESLDRIDFQNETISFENKNSLSIVSKNEIKNKQSACKKTNTINVEVKPSEKIHKKESRQEYVDQHDFSARTRDSMIRDDCPAESRDEEKVSESIVADFLSAETRNKFEKFQKMFGVIKSSKTSQTLDFAEKETRKTTKKLESTFVVRSGATNTSVQPFNDNNTFVCSDVEPQNKLEKIESLLENGYSKTQSNVKSPDMNKTSGSLDSTTKIMPKEIVMHAMIKDRVDPSILDGDPNLPAELKNEKTPTKKEAAFLSEIPTQSNGVALKDDPRFTKFFKMLKMDMPKEVVRHALTRDGHDSAILDGDSNLPVVIPKKTSKESESAPEIALKDDPSFNKYLKMLKVGMPSDSVKHAMKRDNIDPNILDGDPNLPAVTSKKISKESESAPKKNIRRTRIHWDNIRQEVKSGSVWALVQEDQDNDVMHIDDLEIKQLFEAEAYIKCNKKNSNDAHVKLDSNVQDQDLNQSNDKKIPSSPKIKATSFVKVINPKRANNGGIILARIKISFDEIARVIDKMENSNLTQQQFQGIIEYLPTPKEIKSFNEYLSGCKSHEERTQLIDSLCECEKFMVATMNVKDAEKKIRALLFQTQFDDAVCELKQDATLIDDACSELSSSLRLRKLLGIVLNVGNRVNMRTATAFSITSLLKLNHAKSMDKKTTILHYVVTVAKRNGESILNFKEELPSLFKAEKVVWEYSLNGVKGLENHLNNIKKFILSEESNKSISSGPNETYEVTTHTTRTLSSTFVAQFVLDAELKIKELRKQIDKANQSYTRLLQYFHEETLKSHEFFSIFVQFSKNVDAAKAEIEKKENIKQQRKRIHSNKSNSISKLSNSIINIKDILDEKMELQLRQSASKNFNSVLVELNTLFSRNRNLKL